MKRKQRARQPLSFHYVPKSLDDGPDQMLTIQNHTDVSLIASMEFVPRNMYGHPLPHVVTTTVHGSDRGATVIPAGGSGHDILRFDGQGFRQVRAVDIHLTALEECDFPALEGEVRAVMIDLDQKATLDPADFWGIGVANANPFGVQLRVVLLDIEQRDRDNPRQVEDVMVLEGDVDIASNSHDVIWLPDEVRGQFDAVDAHLVPQTLV